MLKKNLDKNALEIFRLYFKNIESLAENIASSERESANRKSSNLKTKIATKFQSVFGSNLSIKINKIKKAIRLILSGKSILFLVDFPNSEDLKDGYFQRVSAIDNILYDYNRIYVRYIFDSSAKGIFPKIFKVKEKVFEIKVSAKNAVHLSALSIIALLIGKIYLHSILRLQSKFNRFLFLISRRRIMDIHGAVPEEFALHEDFANSRTFNNIERFAVRHASIIIGVTEKMNKYIEKKHRIKKSDNFIVLPILLEMENFRKEKGNSRLIPSFTAGGCKSGNKSTKCLNLLTGIKTCMSLLF